MRELLGRFRPRHPVLGAAGSRMALPFAELYFRRKQIHRSTSHFAAERFPQEGLVRQSWRASWVEARCTERSAPKPDANYFI